MCQSCMSITTTTCPPPDSATRYCHSLPAALQTSQHSLTLTHSYCALAAPFALLVRRCATATNLDGHSLPPGSGDTKAVQDLRSRCCKHTLKGHTGCVKCCAITPDGRTLVSGSWDGTLRVWDMSSGRCRHMLEHGCGRSPKDLLTLVYVSMFGLSTQPAPLAISCCTITPNGGHTVVSGSDLTNILARFIFMYFSAWAWLRCSTSSKTT